MAEYDRDCPLCDSETEKKNTLNGEHRVCTNDDCNWAVSIS